MLGGDGQEHQQQQKIFSFRSTSESIPSKKSFWELFSPSKVGIFPLRSMAESVDFRLEQSIPELQDLVHKELFTQEEVKSIVKKRTQHEHTLLRPSAKKADYIRYITYEQSLEKLRQKRLKRKKQKSKKSVSDYAGQRRIRNLFERACIRFQDLGLWMQYIEYVKEQGSHKITNKVFGEYVSSKLYAYLSLGRCKTSLRQLSCGY